MQRADIEENVRIQLGKCGILSISRVASVASRERANERVKREMGTQRVPNDEGARATKQWQSPEISALFFNAHMAISHSRNICFFFFKRYHIIPKIVIYATREFEVKN